VTSSNKSEQRSSSGSAARKSGSRGYAAAISASISAEVAERAAAAGAHPRRAGDPVGDDQRAVELLGQLDLAARHRRGERAIVRGVLAEVSELGEPGGQHVAVAIEDQRAQVDLVVAPAVLLLEREDQDLAVLLDHLELGAVERRHVDLERGPHRRGRLAPTARATRRDRSRWPA